MLDAIGNLRRYIVLTRHAIERQESVYLFVSPEVHPGDAMQVFAFDDDYSFGILQSEDHRCWFEARCSSLGSALRYTSSTVWTSFPWPQAPTEENVTAVVDAVAGLLDLRQRYLDDGITYDEQYGSLDDPGANPLRDAHVRLNTAVRVTYGFNEEDDLLAQIFALNQSIAELEREGHIARGPGPLGLAGANRTAFRVEAPRL